MKCKVGPSIPIPTVHLFHSDEKAKRFFERHGWVYEPPEASDAVTWLFYKRGEIIGIVLMRERGSENDDAALIAHESTHMAFGIMKAIGEDEYGEEEFCYVVQSVTLALLNAHVRWRERHR